MHLLFTEEEREFIEMKPFDWRVKKNCPDAIRVELEKKLELLKVGTSK